MPDPIPSSPVIVVGAGPAGLSAAMCLSEAGFKVRLIERSSRVGGKVYSEREEGRSIEHSVHGWWTNYFNFDRLLEWSGVELSTAFKHADESAMVLADGQVHRLKLPKIDWPSPLFLLVQGAEMAGLVPASDGLASIPFLIHVLAFDASKDTAFYDGFSFAELLRRTEVPQSVIDTGLEAFALSFDFTPMEEVSAAAVLSALQFYVLPTQDSFTTRWSRGLPAEVVFAPIVESLKAHGVELVLETGLVSVQLERNAVVGVTTVVGDAPAWSGAEVEIGRVPLSSIPDDGYLAVETTEGQVFVGRFGGDIRALSALCTHRGCPVGWQSGESQFVCPCHGGRFDATGSVLQGPPKTPLPTIAHHVEGADLVLVSVTPPVVTPCADVVLAMDVEASKATLGASAGVSPRLLEAMSHLDTSPAIVVRLWFDTDLPTRHGLETAFTCGQRFIDDFFHLNRYDPSVAVEGHVVEVQAYDVADKLELSDEAILAMVFEDLAVIDPAYRHDAMRHFHIQRHARLFTRFGPGQAAWRPDQDSGAEGLWLAGDWTRMDFDVWSMERAVVSGLRAANAVRARYGVPPMPILRLPPEGWMLAESRRVARRLRKLLSWGPP